MTNHNSEATQESRRFQAAFQTRQFEIDLFWKRSLFFWGFIAGAFIGIAALKDQEPTLSLLVSGFGMVCSLAWTLANRGSKYWQEQWETKIEAIEDLITGPLFKQEEDPQDKGWWLGGRRYSVSKLTIAVSDYVFLVWLCIFARRAWLSLALLGWGWSVRLAILAMCLLPVVYSCLVSGFGRSTRRQ